MTEKDTKFIAINIPKELHRQFKLKCADQETTIKREVVRMIEGFVKNGDKDE